MFRFKAKSPKIDSKTKLRRPSRRTVNLIPRPESEGNAQAHQYGDHNRPETLLLSVEANQATCCLQLSSPYYKSRAAALIIRGRVLGCVYGNKGLPYQLFGKTAYDYMHRELTQKDSELESYPLEEELILAAAAMFNGEIIDNLSGLPATEAFKQAHEALVASGRPGTIVILDHEASAIYSTYYFKGQIVGSYSHDDGWCKPEYASAKPYLELPGATVSGASLQAQSFEEIWGLTFSLSGLGDRMVQDWQAPKTEDVKNVMLIGYANKNNRSTQSVDLNRFVPKFTRTGHASSGDNQIKNPYKINTLLGS